MIEFSVDPSSGTENAAIRERMKREVPGAADRGRVNLNVLYVESEKKLRVIEPVLDVLAGWGFTWVRHEIGDGYLEWHVHGPDGQPVFGISEDAVPLDDPKLAVDIVLAVKMAWEAGKQAT